MNLKMSIHNSLESESIEIIREAVATARNSVMMYSIGKDSSVMLHLARKAFYPAPPPFPLLHVDTGWKFKAMYAHRTRMDTAEMHPETAQMMIINPLSGGDLKGLFSTHPATEQRVARLLEMARSWR